MRKPLVAALALLGVLVLIAFAVLLINQTAQVVALADRVHPTLAAVVLWGLIGLYVLCCGVPVVLWLRLPKPLTPPECEGSPEFPVHLQALARRLRDNPRLADRPLATREDVAAALKVLDEHANRVIKASAAQVFVTTAVSQNGSLDALIVLAAQSRLIWQVAHVYYQRPTVRDFLALYANVAGTAIVSSQLEDLDLTEQVQPVITSVLGSVAGAIPGLQAATSLVMNSLVTGTANAFLTLRVGLIARSYCGALVLPERRALRRLAVSQAAQMLGLVVKDCARRVGAAFVTASRARTGDAAREIGAYVRRAGTALADRLRAQREEGTGK
ncbi:MAG: DUF697 domain-containing protein [Candidatus Methylomirabilales bacterium]